MSPPVPTAVALADHWYVVAEDDLRARARRFADGLAARRAGSEVLFASKAFPATAVLRVFAEEGLGCDVASGGELHTALHAGFDRGERNPVVGVAPLDRGLRGAASGQLPSPGSSSHGRRPI